jgi:hypothetical protein
VRRRLSIGRPIDDQNHVRAARREHRHIARELNRISESFVHMDEDRLAVDSFLAEPQGLGEFRIGRRKRPDLPPCFMPGPTRLEITQQQMQVSQAHLHLGVIRVEAL